MKTQHTPGPWFINGPYDFESDLFIRATVDGENCDIASTYDDETGNAQANAKLIASAPELLEALKKTVSELKDWRDHWNNEADSFNHPSQEQEYGMCKDRAARLTEQIQAIEFY